MTSRPGRGGLTVPVDHCQASEQGWSFKTRMQRDVCTMACGEPPCWVPHIKCIMASGSQQHHVLSKGVKERANILLFIT